MFVLMHSFWNRQTWLKCKCKTGRWNEIFDRHWIVHVLIKISTLNTNLTAIMNIPDLAIQYETAVTGGLWKAEQDAGWFMACGGRRREQRSLTNSVERGGQSYTCCVAELRRTRWRCFRKMSSYLLRKTSWRGRQHVSQTSPVLGCRYASLNDRDTFWEMRRWAISSSCERRRVYLHRLSTVQPTTRLGYMV